VEMNGGDVASVIGASWVGSDSVFVRVVCYSSLPRRRAQGWCADRRLDLFLWIRPEEQGPPPLDVPPPGA